MNDVAVKPRARVEEERTRRRRRDDLTDGRLRNLAIEGELDPRYVYRWINDEPGRVYRMTVADDWDRVTTDMLGARHEKDRNVGSGVERVVDRATGKKAVLVRKLREYFDEDRAKAQRYLDDLDQRIKHGEVPTGEGTTLRKMSATEYVPAGGIVINDGRRS